MSDLSQRIMRAWLKRNPEPEEKVWGEWNERHRVLSMQLSFKAYESAVIQFLIGDANHSYSRDPIVQEWLAWWIDESGGPVGRKLTGKGSSIAEALLNAIEAIDDTK